MAQQTSVKLSQDKLDLEGVQITFTVHIGDWVKQVAISPIDYKVFKRWHEVYGERVVESIVRDIEYQLAKDRKERI